MNFDQYRLQPLPPQKKPIWKILALGVIAILLISIMTYAFINPRIICEATGGWWLPYPTWRNEYMKRNPGFYLDIWGFTDKSPEERDSLGKCFR